MTASADIYDDLWMPTPSGLSRFWSWSKKTISEEGFIDFVAKLSPWLAPLPSAFFVYEATLDHLTSWKALAVVIAVVIETLGLTTTHTALGMYSWNQEHPEKKSPFGLAVVLAIVYIATTLVLIAVLKVIPEWKEYAPAVFPFLAVVGGVNLALRSHHNRRVRFEFKTHETNRSRQWQIEDEERELRHEERRMKMASKYGLTVTSSVASPVTKNGTFSGVTESSHTKEERYATILAAFKDDPRPSATKLARTLKVDRRTVYRDIDDLVALGKLVRDGSGKANIA